MNARATVLFLCAALALAEIACGQSGKPMGLDLRSRTRFELEWKRYQEFEPYRAMAVSGDTRGRYAMGYAFGEPDAESAAAAALVACASRRRDLDLEPPCRLYATGSEIAADEGDR